MRRLYFAFGSNLDLEQLHDRCRGAVVVGPATLPDHELAFTGFSRNQGSGVATVRPRPGAIVVGAVFVLTRADWRALDRYEGTPWLYTRRSAVVRLVDERLLRVVLYLRARDEAERVPSYGYLSSIRAGYRAFALDPAPLDDALTRAYSAEINGDAPP